MKRRKSPLKSIPRPVRWFAPNEKAFDKLVAFGASPGGIYKGWKGQTPDKFRMRPGECLGVVDGLRAFGGKRAINAAVKAIHTQGAFIFDYDSQMDSRTDALEMRDAATRSRRPMPDDEKLRRADARRKKDGKMTKHDAYTTWHRHDMTVLQKAEVTGWSPQALYDAFGKTGAPTGRPPKDKR